MRKYFSFSILLVLVLTVAYCTACGNDNTSTNDGAQQPPPTPPRQVTIPPFNADSAYQYIAQQVAFGPRVLGSEGHDATAAWLVTQLKATGARVLEQEFTATVYTGEKFPATNIIAQFNPEVSDRIIIAAHWDTRHIADSPLNEERVDVPILGADDGGSGVGVILELARNLATHPVGIGVDLILFDAEDYGESGGEPETYCLGSQYWARNPHSPYKARYGILLDMVSAKNAEFRVEGYSWQMAQPIVQKVWTLAQQMGKSNYFILEGGPGITDDHYFMNSIANVPTIDIINTAGTEETAFGPHWHTHDDDMDIIDKNVLRAVGQVVTAVIYREDAGTL